MSEANAQEPTMEEILASIRRIISEDEAPPAEAAPEPEAPPEPPALHAVEPPPPPPPEVKPAKVEALRPPPPAAEAPPPPPKADVLELTQRVEAPAPPSPPGDLDFAAPAAAATAPPPRPQPAPAGSLVSDTAASAAAGHFGALAQSVAAPPSGRSLEELVSEMLRPMLKTWLDENLPKIVEASVAAEVERISRRGY